MKKWTVLLQALILLTLAAGSADAASIAGRLGITAQLGFASPADSSFTEGFVRANSLRDDKLEPGSAFIGGGGLIFGLTPNLALEAAAHYQPSIEYGNSGVKALEISSTNVSLGLQLRNNVSPDLAAYLGAGFDVLLSEVEDPDGNQGDADTVVGGHVHMGGDYFVSPSIALNLDLRGVIFPEADLKSGGGTVARYSPTSFIGLVGVRFFLN